ncbi:unnamed protein product [Litomosoides sigmodontis]|uniref:RRM domain-containing protein n=1 Tax=Litomosoides sigmodontis TaxID=42156 RepID=A0A3P6VCV7_LITSI|nr:unnamed protein product [Litomosoides sigmodontis]
MECDVDQKFNDDDNLGHPSNKASINSKNVSSRKKCNKKRRRKRPRTKALRRTIREKIEIALCTSDSPIQNILETDMDCAVSAPLSSVIKLLKLDSDEYQRLSCEALISIGNLSKFFSIVGNSVNSLQLVLKANDMDQSSTVVYVDNLPPGCEVDSLQKWASTFGTVVFVRPIMEGKVNQKKNSATNHMSTSSEESTSATCTGRFFQSAFIKFVDEQTPVDFIKFHRLLRKKAASKRRKKLKLERKKAVKKSANSTLKNRSKKLQRTSRKKKKKTEEQKIKNEEAMEADGEKMEVGVDSTTDVARGGERNHSKRRKRKRQSSLEMDGVLFKKSKTTGDANNVANELEKTFRDVGTDVPEECMLSEVGAATKKRKRVHRQKQKRCDSNSKNSNQRPKKYFHNIQAYSFDTFQKLRAKYLELKKQQMVQLKATLKERGVPNALLGLTKKERKKKRGRSRLMMRVARLHEYEDLTHRIPEEDKLADMQGFDKKFSSTTS